MLEMIGEHLNYGWSKDQIEKAVWMINCNKNIHQLVEEFNRNIIECIILVDWLINKGRCEQKNVLGYRIKEEIAKRETIKIL